MGHHFDLDQAFWQALCARIEALLSAQAPLMAPDCPACVECHAQRLTAQLLAQGAQTPASTEPGGDVQAVDVDSMALVRPRTVGVEAASGMGFTRPQSGAA